jgi:large subunit ribosomal protein L18
MALPTIHRLNVESRREAARRRRHLRIRKKIFGTAARPRLVVFRSSKHIGGQLVDDVRGICLTGFSTTSKELLARLGADRSKTARARLAGLLLAERAKALGIETVVFDRAGYRYHGRVKAFAEGAREGGLRF